MNPRRACDRSRDMRNSRVALFDGIEEGGIRASSSYSHEIDEHENERAMEGLQDRVNLLKRVTELITYIYVLKLLFFTVNTNVMQTYSDKCHFNSCQVIYMRRSIATIHAGLDADGNDMDASRGILSGTMDKFKML
ncbi:hypothetical protein GOBAR_DD35322 [Gossypium barbadense]|nr:hypothetical protein GOBAR_DD35322 [Gossypium barbadense]